ncbi:TRAP transporter substrate-binding protein [Celeribacter halophilus]|uniref:TRAP-type C4-dicarboxylate transport system, substrate-binding protein n=1 Tax=Celeribacter halophilus TaxID=576117 RepID=A0A1I3VBW9_9RHOB|nr:TRAP transporter substrate-binding protein [Celeribacter halophilus]PZX09573.1 TRAP-type C4-dicarboxylate transport system substrate-binding protein [Celeribacter halophilus]SFJ91631.1 TRAP-type C4-dicarboxylate transport system, substrate-binding protein [Celeribacter halophilus]
MKLKHSLIALISAAAAFGSAQTALAETKFNMANEYADTSFQADGDRFFLERVNELTNGSVAIDYFPGGGLGYKSADHFYAVSDAAIDIANTFIGQLSGVDPIFLLPSQPFVVTSEKEAKVLEEVLASRYAKTFADNNQVYLFSSPWPPSGLWSREPVSDTAGLQDLKVRVADANATIVFQEAGAAPLQLSWGDVMAQLATNALDAAVTSAEGGVNSKLWEFLPNYLAVNYTTPVNVIHMNLDAFEALSDDEQAAVRQAAQETVDRQWGLLAERLQENYAILRENNVDVVEEVPADVLTTLRSASDASMASWLEKAGPDGAAILEEYKSKMQ